MSVAAALEVSAVFHPAGTGLRRKMISLLAILVVFNLAGWIWAFASFHAFPFLLGTALVAYLFGLRHAVDADHIAAIDHVSASCFRHCYRPFSCACALRRFMSISKNCATAPLERMSLHFF